MHFKKIKLDNIANIYSGGTPSTKKSEYWNGNYNWLSSGETRNSYIITTEKTITKEGIENSTTKLAKKNSIVIASAGQGFTRGQASLTKIDTYVNQSIIVVDPNKTKINPLYLLYWFKLKYNELRQLSDSNSIRGSITTKIIRNLKIELPPLLFQNKIANIINYIDSLICTNKKTNKNLESLIQLIYKEWFVLYNFPDKDKKHYKSNNGRFKDSKIGNIPEKWNLVNLGDLAEVKGRIGWRGYKSSDLVKEGPWVIGGKEIVNNFINLNCAKHISKTKFDESPEIKLKHEDIILSKTGTIGHVAMYYEDYGEATINPNTAIIRSNKLDSVFLFIFLKSERAQHYLKEYTTSSVQPAINQKTIKKLQLALPQDKSILNKFKSIANQINEIQHNLMIENKKLMKLRDTLLPKLMSGELDVSEIDI